MTPTRLTLASILCLGFIFPTAGPCSADGPRLRSDPDLSVPSDLVAPHPLLGLEADLLGPIFESYAFRVEYAPVPNASFFWSPSWAYLPGTWAMGLEFGSHFWPAGDGLQGIFVGPSVSLALVDRFDPFAVMLSAETGYRYFLDGVTFGAALGVNHFLPFDGRAKDPWSLRLLATLGYAWE